MGGDSRQVMILITAAGASRRMQGRDKLLEPVDGAPLLARQARRALATGAPVRVTLPPRCSARRDALAGLAVKVLTVADAAEGMAASIRAGARAAAQAGAAGLMVLPADMPDITSADMGRMIGAFAAAASPPILRATSEAGEWGHPVIVPERLFKELQDITGDSGARSVLRRHADEVTPLALAGRRALVDLDTPQDWAAWRARPE